MPRPTLFAHAFTACIATASCVAAADHNSGEQNIDVSQIMAMDKTSNGEPSKEKSTPFPDFKEVTKEMVSTEGLFTLWSYPKSAKDKDSEKLLCQIPSGILGEQFMLSTSLSGGGFFTGFPLDERVVKWEILDKQLLLIEPNTQFVVDSKKTISDVVRRTYPERIRTSVKIITKSPSGDPVIDLGPLLKSSFADIAWMSMGRGGSINSSLSKWTTKKAFELNVEIGVELAVSNKNPPGSYDKKMVHYSFWKLPKSDYKPRVADDRVGYFLTVNRDWSKPTSARDLFNRYVDRWHLVKRDTSLDMCEPKEPIVFYIEKTVPVRFRRAVRDGILDWNKAFEKIGFVDAVQVRQQTDDNEWKDLDPEDMRYSFFRWVVSGSSFAMGPHRANPFTGQIYDADIIFNDSMVRVWEDRFHRNTSQSIAAMKISDPTLREFMSRYPQFQRPHRDWEQFRFGEEDMAAVREAGRKRMIDRGHHGCDYMEGMKHQIAVARTMLSEQPSEVIERFLYDVIKEVVTHEVGHTLGLRHNFKASTIYDLEEIKRRRTTGEATSGSVMDYNPTLFFEDEMMEGHFVTPTIGPYDYWAIEYGYRPEDGSYKSPTSEAEEDAKPDEKDKSAELASSAPNGFDIPEDVLEKLPPEARKLIEDGLAKASEGKKPADEDKKPEESPFSGPNSAELKMLDKIASRSAEPELVYASDEDTTFLSPDPRSNRFDMGSSPIEWAQERIKLADKRLGNILEWSVKDKESWYHSRSALITLIFEKTLSLDYVARYIGGINTSRSHRGDPGAPPPFTLVDAKQQREAMAFVQDNLFSDDFFSIPPETLNHLSVPRWWHAGASIDFIVDFPIHDLIGVLQWWHLFDRLYPNTLRRIHDSELKTDSDDKFTVAEYLQGIQDACWSDATDANRAKGRKWSDGSPFVSSVRRSLQRQYVGVLEPLVRMRPGTLMSPDLHAMVEHSLRTLGKRIEGVLAAGKLDFASEAHLTSCKSRIERVLQLEFTEDAPRRF